jgi:hypothetical protein
LVSFFIASFAIELETNARRAAFLSQYPWASSHRWIVSQVLSMSACQDRTPMLLVVLIEICDLLLHRSSRT